MKQKVNTKKKKNPGLFYLLMCSILMFYSISEKYINKNISIYILSFLLSFLFSYFYSVFGSGLLFYKDTNYFSFYFLAAFIEELIKISPLLIIGFFQKEYKQIIHLFGVLGLVFLEMFLYYQKFIIESSSSMVDFVFQRMFVSLIHLSFFLFFWFLYKKYKEYFFEIFFVIVSIHFIYNIVIDKL